MWILDLYRYATKTSITSPPTFPSFALGNPRLGNQIIRTNVRFETIISRPSLTGFGRIRSPAALRTVHSALARGSENSRALRWISSAAQRPLDDIAPQYLPHFVAVVVIPVGEQHANGRMPVRIRIDVGLEIDVLALRSGKLLGHTRCGKVPNACAISQPGYEGGSFAQTAARGSRREILQMCHLRLVQSFDQRNHEIDRAVEVATVHHAIMCMGIADRYDHVDGRHTAAG